jgi:hypothetical protein
MDDDRPEIREWAAKLRTGAWELKAAAVEPYDECAKTMEAARAACERARTLLRRAPPGD